jgi:hypothetical protein
VGVQPKAQEITNGSRSARQPAPEPIVIDRAQLRRRQHNLQTLFSRQSPIGIRQPHSRKIMNHNYAVNALISQAEYRS